MRISEKIDHGLSELRIVLPGVQALLGFQFSTLFTQKFDQLEPLLKYAHIGALALIALATILLMSPAAYHRIVDNGHDSERFNNFITVTLVSAMALLGVGLSANIFIVVAMVFGSHLAALITAVVGLTIFYTFWFGLSIFVIKRLAN